MTGCFHSIVYAVAVLCGATPTSVPVPLDNAGLRRAGMTRHWEATVPLTKGDAVKDAFLVDDVLYAVAKGGTVFALTADVGLIRWGVKLTEWYNPVLRPSHIVSAEGLGPTVIPTIDSVFIVDRFTGDLIHTVRPPITLSSTAIGLGTHLLMGSAGGGLFAFEWGCTTGPVPVKTWELRTGGLVRAAPTAYDGTKLIFAADDGGVYSCTALDKRHLWSFDTGGPVLADPVEMDGGVYVASMSRSLYKLDTETGEPIWRIRLEDPLDTAPMVTSDTVFQALKSRGLVAVDADSGALKWRVDDGKTLVAHFPRRDVVFTSKNYLKVLDHESGRPVISLYTSPTCRAAANSFSDAVYLYEPTGRVTCLRSRSAGYLKPREVNAARARLTVPPPAGGSDSAAAAEDEAASAATGEDPFRSRRDTRSE